MAGKKYKAAKELVDSNKQYPYAEAVALAKKTNTAKFDATVEVSFSLNVDPRQADQNIRGAMVLPNGTGRSQRVLVVTQGAKAEEAKNAGADIVGAADVLEKIKGGWMDFDVIVATPDMMGQLGRLGKILGLYICGYDAGHTADQQIVAEQGEDGTGLQIGRNLVLVLADRIDKGMRLVRDQKFFEAHGTHAKKLEAVAVRVLEFRDQHGGFQHAQGGHIPQ